MIQLVNDKRPLGVSWEGNTPTLIEEEEEEEYFIDQLRTHEGHSNYND